MVEISFPDPNGATLKLRVTGHSGAGPRGADPVCAAVSGLLLAFLGGSETEMDVTVCGEVADGVCDVTVHAPRGRAKAFRTVARVFRYGFCRLAETHPERVRLVN
ncbi:MAG: ribosomal-processing cysteine protease Prp [Candidatus Riflebacteria bacterium]|nr:ribosomal-processing cysteine protease Prp [Candidatus Riflebacteria bacterium]